jgi:hypothetical protein
MADTYKGESPAKKLARFIYWIGVQRELGAKRFLTGKHLVLASREGGDISYLLGQDVPPQNIIAVEINPEAAMMVQEKFPKVRVICGEAEQIAREFKNSLVSAYLDFCSTIQKPLLEKIVKIMKFSMRSGGVIGCAFINGRERDREIVTELGESKERAWIYHADVDKMSDRELAYEYMSNMGDFIFPFSQIARNKFHILDFLNAHEDNACAVAKQIRPLFKESKNVSLAAIVRAHYVMKQLVQLGVTYRCAPVPLRFMNYMSTTKTSKGIPMFIVQGVVFKSLPGTPVRNFKRKYSTTAYRRLPTIVNCDIDEDEIRRVVLSFIAWLEEEGYTTEDAHMLFNIPKGTVTAYKAHQARGSYD